MARLDITKLTKSFDGNPILRGVGFHVAAGELVAILGASGSGKTSLLRLIAGFERPDSGEIRLEHEIMATRTAFRRPEQRGIGYVAQEGALFPHLSVAENISFGLSRAERKTRHRVAELLELVGLPAHYAHRAPQQLSGGEQQRVALARALAPNPKLLLLDEPFSALDAGLRVDTREAVAAAIRAAGATAILVTHDRQEAFAMGQRVGVLLHGVLAQICSPELLYRAPANEAVASFVGDTVFLPGIAAAGRAHCALGDVPVTQSELTGPVTLMIRPEQIKITPDAQLGTVPAIIKAVAFHGSDAVVTLSIKTIFPADDIKARIFSHAMPPAGGDVWLQVEGAAVAYPAACATSSIEMSLA